MQREVLRSDVSDEVAMTCVHPPSVQNLAFDDIVVLAMIELDVLGAV